MVLQLLTLGAALSASENSSTALSVAKQRSYGNAQGNFIIFQEIDYEFERYGFFNHLTRNVKKILTGAISLPVSDVKNIIEYNNTSNLYDREDAHSERLYELHKGAFVEITTYSGDIYYLEGDLKQAIKIFKNKRGR